MSYPVGKFSEDTQILQRALIAAGFDVGKDGPDGIMGDDTIKAIGDARDHYGLPAPRNKLDLPLLIALGVRNKPKPNPKGLFDMNSTWLTTFVASTAFKYLVAMIATYVASKLGLDPVEGKATIEGVLTQLVGVAMGIWGMWESSRQKIVMNGSKVSVSDLTQAQQKTVSDIVEAKK